MTSAPATNQPTPLPNEAASNGGVPVPASVQQIMATNAKVNSRVGGTNVVALKSSYQPSGKVGPLAWPLMFAFALVSGLLVGTVYHFVAPNFNTLLFTQLVLGAALGAFMFVGATLSKLRSPRFGVGWGVVATLVLYATFHTWGAWQMRQEILSIVSTKVASSSGGKMGAPAVRARMERRFTLPRAIGMYWRDNYRYGVTLRDEDASKTGTSSGSGTQLTGLAYVALFVCEMGLTALIAAIATGAVSTRRFSEESNRYFVRKRVFGLSAAGLAPTVRAFQAEQWAQAAQNGVKQIKKENPATVFASTVPGAPTGWLEVIYSVNNQPKMVFEKEVPIEALRTLGARV